MESIENNKIYLDYKVAQVHELYDAFINYGYNVRKTNKSGYDAWIAIKKDIPEEIISWKTSAKGVIYNQLNVKFNIPDVKPTKNLDCKGQLRWERNYFLLQHGRVIKNYPTASLTKLFQIAYNAGQFKAENEMDPYPQAHLQYYINADLSKVTSFVEVDSLNAVKLDVYKKSKKFINLYEKNQNS